MDATRYRIPIWVSNFPFSIREPGCHFSDQEFGDAEFLPQPICSPFFYSFEHELLMHQINTSDWSIHCQWLTWLNSFNRIEHPMGLAALVDQYEPPHWKLQFWKSFCTQCFWEAPWNIVSSPSDCFKVLPFGFHQLPHLARVQWIEWKASVSGWLDAVHYKSLQYSSGNFSIEIYYEANPEKVKSSIREIRCIQCTLRQEGCFCVSVAVMCWRRILLEHYIRRLRFIHELKCSCRKGKLHMLAFH